MITIPSVANATPANTSAADAIPITWNQESGRRRRRRRDSNTRSVRISSLSYRCFLLSVLVLLKFHDSEWRSRSASWKTFPTAEAFVPTTAPRIIPTSNANANANHRQCRKRTRHATSANADTKRNRNIALWFFSIGRNKQNVNYNEGDPDLPLARYVDLSANYTLAATPEDYIDLQNGQRLVCVGDVHGDLDALSKFLETAGVYDPSTQSWCGGNTVLVQCGDVLDRGFEELACYQLLARLSHEALAEGGRLVLLIGNHEVLNAMGLFQYACTDQEHEQYIGSAVDDAINGAQNKWRIQYVGNQPSRWASYEPGGLLAHSLMRNMKVAIRVGKTICVHAGLKPQHLKDHGGIEGMNAAFREWITLGEEPTSVPYKQGGGEQRSVAQQLKDNPLVYNHHGQYPANMVSPEEQPWIDAQKRQTFYIQSTPSFLASNPQDPGPIWMREYSSPHDVPPHDADGSLRAMLDETLLLLDADRMVMGHTIQRKINAAFGGKAWRIDVGASKGCLNGKPEVLEVVGNHDGPETVFVLTSGSAPGIGTKIPARERMVDSYTAAAVSMM